MPRPSRFTAVVFCASLLSVRVEAQTTLPYRDSTRSVTARVADLLGRMNREEKFWQLFMIPGDLDDPSHDYSHGVFGLQIRPATAARINAIQRYFVERTRLGIPIIPFEEAVHGLAADSATMFPAAIALAASWDTALMGRVAGAIADETRGRGIRQVLSPVLNIANDVRWGRVEETYGEDPLLTSRMGNAFITAFERRGIVATPKHFIANVGEGGRDSYPIEVSDRQLAELFLPPFEDAVRSAHARSVMTAYNSVDGLPATQNPRLLNGILKHDWGFTGFVISDAAATGGATVLHMTEPNTPTAAKHAWEAGLDVVFQSSWEQHRPYWETVRTGMVADSVINAAVARVLRAKFELGLFEHPYVDTTSAMSGLAEHRALAREAAREGIVLLKNAHNVLPLGNAPRVIGVIGTDAATPRLGGYSGPGVHPVSILDGIRARAGTARVVYAPGPGHAVNDAEVIPAQWTSGFKAEYFDNITLAGTPRIVRTDSTINFAWTLNSPGRGVRSDWFSVRWTGKVTVPERGVHRIGVQGNDGYRLYLDDRLIIDAWRKQTVRRQMADVTLEPGHAHDVRLEFYEGVGNARIKLVWDAVPVAPTVDPDPIEIARQSDVVVIAGGVEEGEFRDRAMLGLPGRQEAMIREIAALGKPVVVVLVGGSAITMPWLDEVNGVLDVWYPGEAGGEAVADVLFGDYGPAGRLPVTFPVAEGQLPLRYNHKPTGRGDDYVDLTGRPLFPFGFGLSYTTFEYSALSVDSGVVRCRVQNSGTVAGDEVVQLYVRGLLTARARPVMELKGFRRVHLAPGETADVSFRLGRDEPGTYRIMVGSSSADIRLRGELIVR